MKRPRHRPSRRRGFTLMELLVVLGILVLLAALVTPRILGTQEKADIKITDTQVKSFKGALERFHLDMRRFPTTEEGLKVLVERPTEEKEGAASRWAGPYLDAEEVPKDPWGNDFQYEYPPTRGKADYPDIWSYGPDGEDNTDDDLVSWKKAEGEAGEPGERGPAEPRDRSTEKAPEPRPTERSSSKN